MVKVFEDKFPKGTQGTRTDGFYIDGYLKSNLDILKQIVKDDWDAVIAVDGMEGSGKSVLAMQAAYYCDPTLTLSRVVFRPDDFKKAIIEAKAYQAVIYDEAYGGMSSRRTMGEVNIALVDMLAEIRQKNLFIFIVMPTYFDLDRYVALWRSRALIHVYAKKFQRGNFQFYNYSKKKEMYVKGKKFYSYCVEANFVGSFMNFYPLSADAYKKKKLESLRLRKGTESERGMTKMQIIRSTQQAILWNMAEYDLRSEPDGKIPKTEYAKRTGIAHRTVFRHFENFVKPKFRDKANTPALIS